MGAGRSNSRWLTAAMVALIALSIAVPAMGAVKRYEVPVEGSPAIGPEKADVTIIEFIDYQ